MYMYMYNMAYEGYLKSSILDIFIRKIFLHSIHVSSKKYMRVLKTNARTI